MPATATVKPADRTWLKGEILFQLPLEMGFARNILRGIESAILEQPGLAILRTDLNLLRYFSGQRVKPPGLIGFFYSPELIDLAQRAARVSVNVSNFQPPSAKVFSVLNDDVEIGRLAARHFIDKGFRRIHFYSSLQPHHAVERWQGIQEACAAAGVEALQSWFEPREELRGFLGAMERPGAIIAQSDWDALIILREIRWLGLSVPTDIAVLGIDDDELAVNADPVPLSSVRPAGATIGRLAVELILAGGAEARQLRVPPEGVIQRLSTDCNAVGDARLRRALAEMERSFRSPVDLQAVARAAGLSRRNFEYLFARHLSTTPARWLTVRRLMEARRLLAGTSLSQEKIVEACGFSGMVQFWRAFQAAEGIAPGKYRERFR